MPLRDTLLPAESIARAPGRVRIPPGAGADPAAGAGPAAAPCPPAADAQAQVEAVRGPDGVIRRILVRCACGAQIVIQCQYPPAAPRPAGGK